MTHTNLDKTLVELAFSVNSEPTNSSSKSFDLLLQACKLLLERMEELETELGEMADHAEQLCEATLCYDGPVSWGPDEEAVWYDTCSLSDRVEAGEWLVKYRGWIKHPKGVGRRQFYRRPNP